MPTVHNVLAGFQYSGRPEERKAFGSGHINRTWKLTMDDGGCYILQNINHHVFTQPEKVMANIIAVTDHLRKKLPEDQAVLEFLPAREGGYCYRDEEGTEYSGRQLTEDGIRIPCKINRSAVELLLRKI